jgi:acyl-[acyl-carrier-protein] desaturase
MPVLRKWRIFEREDFTGEAARLRDDLGVLINDLEVASDKFDESKQRYLEREARKAEKITAARVLKTEVALSLSGR